ncbi:peptidase M20 [Halobacteriales archaeon SW_7_71_33]|nr:MAG: peptidase M20 [Halobacteriales archaeon SW_7_71_33]
MGFETYSWEADAEALAGHPSFPDDPAAIDTEDRSSVAGVFEFGDPSAGPTVVLNGHVDVVPVESTSWSSDPFEPTWSDDGDRLTARGAADMKAGLGACVFAARALRSAVDDSQESDLDGRVVVESVAGEEEGGVGAAAAALSNPYPFERDAALVAEPTELRPVVATEGTVMRRLVVEGRSAHAATRWHGESVLPHFERLRQALFDLEAERSATVEHPLYDYETPWPVTVGQVEAGTWSSSVPARLEAEVRIGVAPGETVAEVERQYDERIATVASESEWLREHPPTFERFSVQFEPAEIDADEPVVRALQAAMRTTGLTGIEPRGATYGADSRHYVAAGIPTVVFGPGSIEQAHFPDETVAWSEVERATRTIAETGRQLLS